MERINCTDYKLGMMFTLGTILFFLLLLKFKKYRHNCCIINKYATSKF